MFPIMKELVQARTEPSSISVVSHAQSPFLFCFNERKTALRIRDTDKLTRFSLLDAVDNSYAIQFV